MHESTLAVDQCTDFGRGAYARRVSTLGPILVLASAMTEPAKGGDGAGVLIAVVAIVVIVGLCLWLLFRRGSIGDRAKVDVPDPDDPPPPEAPAP